MSAEALQVADTPCTVLLSATGRVLRIEREAEIEEYLGRSTRPTAHGAVLAAVATTVRGEVGAVLENGLIHRFSPVDLPLVPAASVAFAAGVQVTSYLGLGDTKLRVVGLVQLDSDTPIGLFTEQGVVKRVVLQDLPAKPEFEVIGLKPRDRVIAAFPAPDDSEFAAVSSDAQLLRFSSANVRPQGRPAGGMAGIKLNPDARVIFATAIPTSTPAHVVTVADSSVTLPGIDVATAKVSAWEEFPAKGRATGGVRAQRFLKGEDQLACAWVGAGEPRAVAADGAIRTLPAELGKRDGSGTPIDGLAAHIGSAP